MTANNALPPNEVLSVKELQDVPLSEVESTSTNESLLESSGFKDMEFASTTRDRHLGAVNLLRLACLVQYRRQRPKRNPQLQDLRLMMNLPPEVMLEIFQYLHPLDLYHLSTTCHAFRTLLAGDLEEARVWKTAFGMSQDLGYDHAPPLPARIHTQRWAYLLFGPATCWECGKESTLPDFAFRRRLCTTCIHALTIKTQDIRHEYLAYILAILPKTRRYDGDGFWYHPRSSPRVLRSSLQTVLKTLDDAPAEMHLLDLPQWYPDYKRLVRRVDNIEQGALDAQAWVTKNYQWLLRRSERVQSCLRARVQQRAVKEGYHPDDLAMALRGDVVPSLSVRAYRMSSRDYQSILESRKPRIKLMEKERLARESQADLAARKKVFEHSIAMRRQRGPFHETKNWPSMDVIVKLEPVKKLLEAPEGSVGPQAWISLFESLSDVIWKWQVDEQVKARSPKRPRRRK